MNFTDKQKEIITTSWKDCHELLQGENFFLPEVRFLDNEGSLRITVIEKNERDALVDYIKSDDVNSEFAVLNNCGFIRKQNQDHKCVISRIFHHNKLGDYFILKAQDVYNFDSEIFSQAIKVSHTSGDRTLSFVFDSPFDGKRVTLMPIIEEMTEISKLAYNSKTDEDWEIFKSKLDGFDLNTVDGAGETVLHKIIYRAPISIIEYLLENKANPNIANQRYERTPAYYTDKVEVHELLIKYGLNVNHLDSSGWTAAHYKLSYPVLETHLKAGLDVSLKSVLGRTIVFEIIETGGTNQLELLNLLESYGAKLDEQDNWGLTPLHVAAQYNNHELIDYFIHKYENLEIKSTKEVKLPITDPPLVLPPSSTVQDLIEVIKTWRNNVTSDWGKNWVEESKSKFEITCRLIINRESLENINNEIAKKKEEERKKVSSENDALINYVKNFDEAMPLISDIKSERKKLLFSFIIVFSGIILLLLSFFLDFSGLIGIGILLVGYFLFRTFYKKLKENLEKAKEIGITK